MIDTLKRQLQELNYLPSPEREFFLRRLTALPTILRDKSLALEIIKEAKETGDYVTSILARKIDTHPSIIDACLFLTGGIHLELDLPVDTILQLYNGKLGVV